MKYLLSAIAMAVSFSASAADVYVQPHVNRDGTYVQGHYRTAPDNTINNNYSTQGNTNPYTGQQGTVQPSYQQPQQYYQPAQPAYTPPSRRSGYNNGY